MLIYIQKIFTLLDKRSSQSEIFTESREMPFLYLFEISVQTGIETG
ncbi:hypothetical protein B4125_2053 [Bacillus paralicheniformis]|nr:hypothetical protein SC10_B2orf03741 [Bacillus paralicheniformis]OLG07872.1 hypothetical protein B4125_2053 [Bacillus paralicheniformis]TWJ61212.1 hypothetical protein CHCC5023_0614 [Bacillus paralicheniformis]TWM01983.1 hypothetical protein CHCC15136_2287 [Bacillus paralicheniformis]